MKIAFVKQDVYQDLYVAPKGAAPLDLLFSTIMRVGPLGLFAECQADFLIVKEENTPECRAWESVIPHYPPEWFRELKDRPFAASPFPEAKFFQPGTGQPHSLYSLSCDSVEWNAYDVVIGINFSIPRRIIDAHRNVLWCYMVGEANILCDRVHYGYDVCLNQETRGIVAERPGVVDFPYTFLGATTLETLLRAHTGREPQRRGIFIEINSFTERPVRDPGHLAHLATPDHPVRLHQQDIRANLIQLFDTKYFTKVGGRKIRGNSVIEAISAGALVLMNPAELHHAQLLPPECWIHSPEEVQNRIRDFEANPAEYTRVREVQRQLLRHFVQEAPLESLRNCLAYKRAHGPIVHQEPARAGIVRRAVREARAAARRILKS